MKRKNETVRFNEEERNKALRIGKKVTGKKKGDLSAGIREAIMAYDKPVPRLDK